MSLRIQQQNMISATMDQCCLMDPPHLFQVPFADRASYYSHGLLQITLLNAFETDNIESILFPDTLSILVTSYIGILQLIGSNKFDIYISEFSKYIMNKGLIIHRPIPNWYWDGDHTRAYLCASSNGYIKGIHEWIIKIKHSKELYKTNHGDAIGIIDELKRSSLSNIDPSYDPSYLTENVNAYYIQRKGIRSIENSNNSDPSNVYWSSLIKCQTRDKNCESQFEPNRISGKYNNSDDDEFEDIIQIQLDCNRWKVNFIINDTRKPCLDIASGRKYYLFVHSVEYDTEYQLLSQF